MTEDAYVRLAVLEEQIQTLIKKQEERDKKLDELLTLKHKGMGAIWLASLIVGTSFITILTSVLDWLRG